MTTILNKIFKIRQLLIAVGVIATLTACSDSKGSHPGEPDDPTTPRTILVYMVAANDLGSSGYDTDDIDEMKQAAEKGDFGRSRLLVYHAPYRGEVQLKEVKTDGTVAILEHYEASSDGSSVTVDRMRRVVSDMKKHAPAKDYGLVLWSHSSGWLADGVQEIVTNKAIHKSYGQDRGKKMNISSLAGAIDDAGFSFIYFDCCFMGAVEVAYEMRHAAKTAVVSAAEVALEGMPYHLSLKPMMAEKADLVEAARSTYEYYQNKTSQYDRSCTISVIDLTRMNALAEATRSIYAAAPSPVPDKYSGVRYCNRSPYKNYYFDFGHYVDALLAGNDEGLARWHSELDKTVIYKAATAYFQSTIDLSIHSGLSTYIFDSADDVSLGGYDTSAWYKDVASALIKP